MQRLTEMEQGRKMKVRDLSINSSWQGQAGFPWINLLHLTRATLYWSERKTHLQF